MLYSLSTLSKEQLESLRALEMKLGKPVLAFSAYRDEPAGLSSAELEALRESESRLGLTLVAVKA